MIARLFERWERSLASVDQDRVVRPFEWGADWTGSDGRSTDASAERIVGEWLHRSLGDTDAFFATEPCREYRFDGEFLTFPSQMAGASPENNKVWAQHFAARRGREKRRAVVVLPQWNADAGGHVGLSRLLAQAGITALRLSLPYHDRRMPPELTRADYIVSPNIARTVQVCRQAVLDARRAIAWLAEEGYERIGILGTSLGSCLSLLTTAHEPLIKAAALNHVSPYFADVVWRGLSTAHVRAGLEGHVDLETLRRLWLPISPQTYLDRIGHARILLVYALYDMTFPVDLSRQLIGEFRRREIPHEVAVLPCGHYTTGVTPFKWMDGYVLTRFLARSL